MSKTLSLIGSTGSIGRQTLAVAREKGHRIVALAAKSNAEDLADQALEFKPDIVAIFDESKRDILHSRLKGSRTIIATGEDGVLAAAAAPGAEVTLNAAVGIAGLKPTLAAIKAKKTLALANKESLVCAGRLVMEAAAANGVKILPVDSEHSAIYQCLRAGSISEVSRVIITASGGPFFGKSREETYGATPQMALNHPVWAMGNRITIDSATLANKAFEMIEAMHLFGLEPNKIEAIIHREGIVHSMVEFCDGATIAQLSPPDMSLAIDYAIDGPKREKSGRAALALHEIGNLTFFKPDEQAFPALTLAKTVMEKGGNTGAIVNGADEAAVAAFLEGRIPFGAIYEHITGALAAVPFVDNPTIAQILESDRLAKDYVARALI